MKRRFNAILIVLLAANLLFSAGLFFQQRLSAPTPAEETLPDGFKPGVKYTLYIGTDDPRTYEPGMSPAEARTVIDAICLKYTTGFTVTAAEGVWTNTKEVPNHEATLIYIFLDLDEKSLNAMVDEVMVALNQNSVLVEKARVGNRFQERPSDR